MGEGIGIAIIDTGIYLHHDLKDRIVAFKDFVAGKDGVKNAYDDQGHGMHVAGDAAGNGKCARGKYKGPACEANLIGVKVLNSEGAGTMFDVINGIQWAVENKDKYNIRVINLSLGSPSLQKAKHDPVALAIEKVVEQGIVPVIAAGNSGPASKTIGTPAIAYNAITVGAYHDNNTVERGDDSMASFSSRGLALRDGWIKPDIASPGVYIVSANAPGSQLDKHPKVPHLDENYIAISGTSMATPIMAGVVAVLLQARPDLTPEAIKRIVMTTADPLPNLGPNDQGSGLVDPAEALQKALSMPK